MNNLDKPLIVVKIGSSSIVKRDDKGETVIDVDKLIALCKSVKDLMDSGNRVLIVSSGAVAAGAHRLNMDRPKASDSSSLSACAAVGQPQLMMIYSKIAESFNFVVAQALLMRSDFHSSSAMENLTGTLETLFTFDNVVPILNENDVTSNDELNFGDNDGIAALIAIMLEADKIIFLSDQDGFMDKDPNVYSDAKLIETISEFSSEMVNPNASKSEFGSGGHGTKVPALDLATFANPKLIGYIANSNRAGELKNIIEGKVTCTKVLVSNNQKLSAESAYDLFAKMKIAAQANSPYIPVSEFLSR